MSGDPGWDWAWLRERCVREAARVLDDPVEAEDVAQEALVRGWRRGASCHGPESQLAWMLTITRHEALRWRSAPRGRRLPPLEDDELAARREAGAGVGEEDVVLERLAVEGAVGRLAPEERRLMQLRYREDLTQVAIAERLSIPEGTVKVRLHRIRGRLREELAA